MEKIKPEILAPAGTLETVKDVLTAGADAVYLSGKKFNMRMHRSSYNLQLGEIAEAISFAHTHGKRVYYVLNNLVNESDLPALRETLTDIGKLAPDALIVQDLGVAAIAREVCVEIDLHASTMMNVHSAETARVLKLLGFTRIIPSRDIPLHEIRRIGEASGVEMEAFVHGDLCIAQSGQCFLSGQMFGESANQGRCMKPCRWDWELTVVQGKDALGEVKDGYLFASKDLCLLQHIPDLVQNNIVSLKIEGRMRSKEFLVPIVQAYRQAVDLYAADPQHYMVRARTMTDIFNRRVRELTTAQTFGRAAADAVEPQGQREPRLFSEAGNAPVLTVSPLMPPSSPLTRPFDLIVRVETSTTADAALEAGANAIYLGNEGFVLQPNRYEKAWLAGFLDRAEGRGSRVAVLSAAINDERDLNEWRQWLQNLRAFRMLSVGVVTLGALHVAKKFNFREIIADARLNATNSAACDELSTQGATRIVANTEMSMERLTGLLTSSRMPIEVIGQGLLPGMLLEHCVIGAACGHTSQSVCPMPCRRGAFELRDTSGQNYRLAADRRCRNHLFSPADVCVLPSLSHLAVAGAAGVRLEMLFDSPETVSRVVRVYREAIDCLRDGTPYDSLNGVAEIKAATNRPQSDGPFAPTAELVPLTIKAT